MNMSEFNRQQYSNFWEALNQELNTRPSLCEALLALEAQQFDVGFIQDDLSSVIHFRLHHPDDKTRLFNVQYNRKRAGRHMGVGRRIPPPGSQPVHDGCFLCKENIVWQQQGVEVGYDIRTASGRYTAWMNPFPLKPVHVTIAAQEHIPQSWIRDDDYQSLQRFKALLSDLLELSRNLPNFIGFYNGVGAGASIPHHFHFHFFKRPEGSGPFPLERAAAKTLQTHKNLTGGVIVNNYPITAIHFYGKTETIIEQTESWIRRLLRPLRYRAALTGNVIASLDTTTPDYLHLYIIPRNKFFAHAPGMVGMIGGLEVLGEIVFSTEIEKQLLDTGQVDFFFVERILSAVAPLGLVTEGLR